MRILSCMNASNPDIPAKVFEDPRSGRLIQQRVVLMMTGVHFKWLTHEPEEDAAANLFLGTLCPFMMSQFCHWSIRGIMN